MCFSATASFSAAAVLGTLGYFSGKLVTNKRQIFLALVPFIFAFQQLLEGFIWLSQSDFGIFHNFPEYGKFFFLFIAISVWPVWISLSLLAVEKDPIRYKLLSLLLFIGVVYNLMMMLEFWQGANDPGINIIGHSIQYVLPSRHSDIYYGAYLSAILIPPFVSSLRYAWVFGILNMIGLAVAQYFYSETFISVWCFFAAIMSVSLYFIFRENFASSSADVHETE